MNLNFTSIPASAVVFTFFAAVSGCDSDGRAVIGEMVDQGDDTTVIEGDSNTDTGGNSNTDSTNVDSTGNEENNGEEPDTDETNTDVANNEFEAVYKATFNATWSTDNHPTNFPSNPHFSPLTGAVHSVQAVFVQIGDLASPGIEDMAETGGTGTLLAEFRSVVDEGRALSAIEGGGIQTSPGSTSVEFLVNRDNPFVTLASMLAPSPDWFVAVSGQKLIDQNGEFFPSLVIGLTLYDAGTDSGTRFTSDDEDTVPKEGISLVSSFQSDTDFMNGLPFVGTITFELQQ